MGLILDKTYNKDDKPKSINLDTISEQVDASAKRHYGEKFTFRPNQKEAIVTTVYKWLKGESENIILQGPTGSGKSAIGLLSAAVMNEYYGKKGYILISDLSLIQQYERDVEKYFPEYAVIKGQQTYICKENGAPFSAGKCKLNGCKSYRDIKKNYLCSDECKYIVERERAIVSPVLVCTYAFWLIQQNIVGRVSSNPPFKKRDFVICDEAHKLVSIIQGHFSPKFVPADMKRIKAVVERGIGMDDEGIIDTIDRIRKTISKEEDNQAIFDLLCEYVDKLSYVLDIVLGIRKELKDKTNNGEELNKDDKYLANSCEYIDEHNKTFSEYIDIITKTGVDHMVKNPVKEEEITFNCIDESYLMGKYFHSNCKSKMFMSATIGDANEYAKDCSIKEHFFIDIPSTFDFTNSPIIYVDKYRLSYQEKSRNLPKIVDLITATINMYAGKRGIIQTGSYEFAKALIDMCPYEVVKRLILYSDTKEKDESIAEFKASDDKVLVGPSLVEGLSFDDDLCRFQIIMKVPYPSLADRFVKAKQTINPQWYANTTAISILQGVGRGVRSEHDYCTTFIFDGCFTRLASDAGNMFPMDFRQRMRFYQPEAFGVV